VPQRFGALRNRNATESSYKVGNAVAVSLTSQVSPASSLTSLTSLCATHYRHVVDCSNQTENGQRPQTRDRSAVEPPQKALLDKAASPWEGVR